MEQVGVFGGVISFVSVVNKTYFVPLYMFIVFVVFGYFEGFEAIRLSLYLLWLVLTFYTIWSVYRVFIVWTVWKSFGLFNAWLCCSLRFLGFARFGVFERFTCFVSVVNKT